MAEVFRDALGIPHIRAADVRDVAAAQGEVTARDRGWQIEVDRLRAAGRLAELVGGAGVTWDVFARCARLDDTARLPETRLRRTSPISPRRGRSSPATAGISCTATPR